MNTNNVSMHVAVNGRACKEYSHNGNTYIEARHGTNYTVKIKNDNPHRVMVVVSVDGLDVVSGKNAAETDTGYIIDAYDSLDIKGYRINDNDCASFIFTSRGKSYVQNVKGDAANCGVIGLRAFREKTNWFIGTPLTYTTLPPVTYTNVPYYVNGDTTTGTVNSVNLIHKVDNFGTTPIAYNCSTTLGASVGAAGNVLRGLKFDTGTGWGDKIEQSVVKVSFEKGLMIGEMTVYYASKQSLEEMGVDTKSKPKVASMPQAFGYCKPPKGWVG